MSKYQLRKNHVIRYICMVMLMLIQFDAYAYDIIHYCANSSADTETCIMNGECVADESNHSVTEWKELDYSRTNTRINLNSGIIYYIPLFIGIILPSIQKDDMSSYKIQTAPCCIRNVRQHVAYCTLII